MDTITIKLPFDWEEAQDFVSSTFCFKQPGHSKSQGDWYWRVRYIEGTPQFEIRITGGGWICNPDTNKLKFMLEYLQFPIFEKPKLTAEEKLKAIQDAINENSDSIWFKTNLQNILNS